MPPRLSVRLLGAGACEVRHAPSGARLRTSRPLAFGGSGDAFSSTDLLAAALGTCIATDLEGLADRHGISREDLVIEVDKALSVRPKRLEGLRVRIRLPDGADDRARLVLARAAEACLVRRSLAPDVRVTVEAGAGHGADEAERACSR